MTTKTNDSDAATLTPLQIASRPKPYVGMLVWVGGTVQSWHTLACGGSTSFHCVGDPLCHMAYIPGSKHLRFPGGWYDVVRLPGEPGCPPIPSELQREWREGDKYWWLQCIGRQCYGWECFRHGGGEPPGPPWYGRALYIPPGAYDDSAESDEAPQAKGSLAKTVFAPQPAKPVIGVDHGFGSALAAWIPGEPPIATLSGELQGMQREINETVAKIRKAMSGQSVSLLAIRRPLCPRCEGGFESLFPASQQCPRCGYPALRSTQQEAPQECRHARLVVRHDGLVACCARGCEALWEFGDGPIYAFPGQGAELIRGPDEPTLQRFDRETKHGDDDWVRWLHVISRAERSERRSHKPLVVATPDASRLWVVVRVAE